MAVGDVFKLVVNQSLQSSVVQNVLYYRIVTETILGKDIDRLKVDFESVIIVGKWQALVSNGVDFDCISLQKVFPLPLEAAQDFDVGLSGLKILESLPAMDCVLMQKVNLSVAGVGKKGRMYIAGLPEDDTAQGRLVQTVVNAWGAFATALQDELAETSSGVYEPGWVTRSTISPFPITGFVKTEVVNLLPRIATQRRRRTPTQSFST